MKIQSVVKVMNFHSLLRVDSAKKQAEKYFRYEEELNDFADNILNNRNLILDKRTLKTNKKGKALNIYIANDLGFCGNFNSNVNEEIKKDKDSEKIIIGEKIMKEGKDILLSITKEQYRIKEKEIENILYRNISENRNKEINIIYNHYYNISKIELVRKKILPIENKKNEKNLYKEDFVIEGDINRILINIIVLYLTYEIRIAEENSYASENIMRQMITKESLKKLEEIEEEELRQERKEKKKANVKETIEKFTNNMSSKTE